MKKIWKLFIIIFILIILGVAIWIVSDFRNYNKKEFRVKTNQEFSITLISNQTTGYSWSLAKPLDEKILKLIENKYVPPKSRALGAPGKQVLKFKAINKGETVIYLEYVRPWEKNAPLEEKSYKVKVD